MNRVLCIMLTMSSFGWDFQIPLNQEGPGLPNEAAFLQHSKDSEAILKQGLYNPYVTLKKLFGILQNERPYFKNSCSEYRR